MPKIAKTLTAMAVSKLTQPGMHAVGGVPGLHLRILKTGAKSWVLRTMIHRRRADLGLGGFPLVSLADARTAARALHLQIRGGEDPLAQRRQTRMERSAMTFAQAAAAYIQAHSPGWKNAKHAQQWHNTLTAYAFPVLGEKLAKDIQTTDVLQVLQPIWTSKTETASRVRNRIELVLDWEAAREQREGKNPARWRGHLEMLLPKPNRVAKTTHQRALAVKDMPAFMAQLRQQKGIAARALEFAILTATRSGEVRGATWREIDLTLGTWAIPGARMKAGRDHRVPLSAPALALLHTLPRFVGEDCVFPAPRGGGMLSDMALSALLRRMAVDAVPHGFRSTFRDWVAELTAYPGDLAEMALAHAIGDKVEAAYRRGDMFEKRRQMMQAWADFCGVTPID